MRRDKIYQYVRDELRTACLLKYERNIAEMIFLITFCEYIRFRSSSLMLSQTDDLEIGGYTPLALLVVVGFLLIYEHIVNALQYGNSVFWFLNGKTSDGC